MASMEMLKSVPSAVAAGLAAMALGSGFIKVDTMGFSLVVFVLALSISVTRSTGRDVKILLGIGALPLVITLIYETLVERTFGDAGVAVLSLFGILFVVTFGSAAHRRAVNEGKTDNWVPIRPGAVAGLKLQNERNRVIRGKIQRDIDYVEKCRTESQGKSALYNAEFETTSKLKAQTEEIEQKCGKELASNVADCCSHYLELLDMNLEAEKKAMEEHDASLKRLDKLMQKHAQTDVNLVWR